METTEQPDQYDDRNRNPEQPEQKTSTHFFLLSLYAEATRVPVQKFQSTPDVELPRLRTKVGPRGVAIDWFAQPPF
jgi:hypothetical protein